MPTVDTFLSCSFDSGDKDVVEFISAIIRGFGFHPTNVSTGSPMTPPEVAKQKIASAQCLIAICTRRSELASGKWVMPQAVQDEIAIAYGTGTPALMLVEDGIELAGFKSNFGTYHSFERAKLTDPGTVGSIVEALQNLFSTVTSSSGTYAAGLAGSHAEFVHHLVELESEGQDFVWSYSTSKKIVYTQASRGGFPAGVWASLPGKIPDQAPPLDWQIETVSSSRDIKVVAEIQKQEPECVEARLRMEPPPDAGDYVEYRTFSRSRYLNPIWDNEATGVPIHLEKGTYKAFDGLLFIHRTQKAVIEFRFTRNYGLSVGDIVPFVGSYTSGFDYEIESEIKRAAVRVEEFGGSVLVRLELDNPLPNAMYGVAWNPRPQPADLGTGESSSK